MRYLALRLGVIAALALVIGGGGMLFTSTFGPLNEAPGRASPMAAETLNASLFDQDMQTALSELRAAGRITSHRSEGARGVYPSPAGQISLTQQDIAMLNVQYRLVAARGGQPHRTSLSELEAELAADLGYGDGTEF